MNKGGVRHLLLFGCIVGLLGLLASCAGETPPLRKISPGEYPAFADDLNYEGLEESIGQSLRYLNRIPAEREFSIGEEKFTAAHMVRSLSFFQAFIQKSPGPAALEKFIRKHYRVYKAAGRPQTDRMLFTGYFEPLLKGSRTPSSQYAYPVYAPPGDLATVDLSLFSSKYKGQRIIGRVEGNSFVPYYDRREIDGLGVLKQKAEVLAWVEDPVALFFLHIQGSGKIALETGEKINVHYHSKNGRAYTSIGQILIDEKKITRQEMSMQRIRQYFREHPEDRERILYENASYVFFSLEKEGPLGALNVRLTPGRSVALDRHIFPMTALVFLQTQKPRVRGGEQGSVSGWADFSRFVLAQDTGGAIKGPGRADIFWGAGPYAEIAAGHLKHPGELYVLVLKPDA